MKPARRRGFQIAGLVAALAGLTCHEPRSAPEEQPPPPQFVPPNFVDGVVDSGGASGPFLLFGAPIGARVVYYDEGFPDYVPLPLGYAECPGNCTTGFHWANVGLGVDAVPSVAAVLTDSTVHIAYTDAYGQGIRYSTCSTGCIQPQQWQTTAIDTISGDGRPFFGNIVSMAKDASGTLHLVYTHGDSTPFSLYYARCGGVCTTSGNWIHSKILDGDVVFGARALQTDQSGRLRLVTSDSQPSIRVVRYGACDSICLDPASWHFTTLGPGSQPSIVVGPGGEIEVAYNLDSQVHYTECRGSCDKAVNWDSTTVGPGSSPRLQRDAAGQLYLVSREAQGLMYAECSTNCQSRGQWQSAPILTNRDVGSFDFAVDAWGVPQIVYVEFSTWNLRLAAPEGAHLRQ